MASFPLGLPDIHGLGHEPDLYDFRDRVFAAEGAEVMLPTKVEQFDLDFPIYDQNGDNACVGFSYKEAAQIVLLKTVGLVTSISPGFLWWLGRATLGWEKNNSGCRIRDVIRLANEYGAASSGTCPYKPGDYATAPSADAFEQAKDHPAFDYASVDNTHAAKIACAAFTPVIFGTVLTESFDKAGRNKGFFPPPAGDVIGGHAMLIVGYDDAVEFPEWETTGGFRYRNHWRATWGDRGWGWLPYKHFDTPAVSDAWVLRGIRA